MRLQQYLTEAYKFQGTCVNSFDDDGDSLIPIFNDVSDFADVEENSKEIEETEFKPKIPNDIKRLLKGHKIIYLYHKRRNIYMIYDDNKDIHYFFA